MAANTIVLNWQDNSGNEDGFNVYQSTNGVTFNYIASVGAGVTTYEATGITESFHYSFRVTAYNAAGESAYIESLPLSCIFSNPPIASPSSSGAGSGVSGRNAIIYTNSRSGYDSSY